MAAQDLQPNTPETDRVDYHASGPGPFLRFFAGLWLVIGICLGLGLLSLPFVAAIYGPGLVRSVQNQVTSGVSQGISNSTFAGLLGPNSVYSISQDAKLRGFQDAPVKVLDCVEKQLTKDQLEKLTKSDTPSADELAILGNCGFDYQTAQKFAESQTQK